MMNTEKVITFDYKGIVTSLNHALCEFVLDDFLKVYAGEFCLKNTPQLPALNEETLIHKAILIEPNTAYLLKNSIISVCKYDETNQTKVEYFCKFLSDTKLGFRDVLDIVKAYEKCLKLDSFNKDFLWGKTKLTLLELIIRVSAHFCMNAKKNIFRKNLSPLNLKFPGHFEVYDVEARPVVLPIFLPHVFGIYEEKSCLLGFLSYEKETNRILLSDAENNLQCLIINNEGPVRLQPFLNNFILIKKYYVITEKFREVGVSDFKYIFFDIRYCEWLDKNKKVYKLAGADDDVLYKCQILRKGPVIYNNFRKNVECWFQLKFANNFICYLTSEHLLNKYPILNVGEEIEIWYPKDENFFYDLTNVYFTSANIELNRIIKDTPASTLPIANIISESFCESKENIENLEIVKQKLYSFDDNLVSFIAVIEEKKLVPALSSRSKLIRPIKGFGTPGSKTHVLVVRGINDKREKATIYLNNFEALSYPLGLIEEMKICVRNVQIQKNYFKSCTLTTFEVLDYIPKRIFNTCHEYTDNIEWGPRHKFTDGRKVPNGILCWTRFVRVKIRSLKICYHCYDCRKDLLKHEPKCCENVKMIYKVTILAQDIEDSVVIIVYDAQVLRIILNIKEESWTLIDDCFSWIRYFSYSCTLRPYEASDDPFFPDDYEYPSDVDSDEENYVGNQHEELFYNIFSNFLDAQQEILSDLELKCRMSNKGEDIAWFAVDARRPKHAQKQCKVINKLPEVPQIEWTWKSAPPSEQGET